MNTERRAYFDQLYQSYRREDAAQIDRLQRWRSIEPESAQFLGLLVLAKRAQNVLEIGTSGGYSTLWLADALEQTGGRLTTLEIEAERQQAAMRHLAANGLQNGVQAVCGDAGAFLAGNREAYDLILLDAERPAYCGYWPHLADALAEAGSTLVVDNVLSHAEQVADFVELVAADQRFTHSILPVGAGLMMVVRQ